MQLSASRPQERTASATGAHDRPFDYGTEAMVPLSRDWLALLHAARRFDSLFIQVRTPWIRMIAATAMPRFARPPASPWFCDGDRTLFLNFDYWLQAWAVVRPCRCCGSPGRVTVQNAYGQELMQWCAPASCETERWADYVAAVTLHPVPRAGRPPVRTPQFPAVPKAAHVVSRDGRDLASLLATLGCTTTRIRASLRTAEASHIREFPPIICEIEDGVLSAGDGVATLQLTLAAVACVAIERGRTGPCLHAVDRGGRVLLTVSSSAIPNDAAAWLDAVRKAFPDAS